MSNPTHGFDPSGTFYELSGCASRAKRNPVVLVHGVGLDHRMWDWLLAPLSVQYPVLRYDLLGHGRTPLKPGTSKLHDYVRQLIDLLDALELETIHLAGYSLGALITQLVCRRHETRLASVTFMNGVYRRVDDELTAVRERLELTRQHGARSTVEMALQRWFTDRYRHEHPDIMARVRERLLSNDLEGYVTAYRCFVHGDAEVGHALAGVRVPALAITGQDDVGSTPDMCRRMAADLLDATVKILPGLRHGAPIEGAQVMAQSMLQFLSGVESC